MPPPHRSKPRPATPEHEVVDPRWLLKAVAWVILAALVCAYLTLCLLFYQGQWQLILHPTRTDTPLPGQPLKFDAAETGTPRLSGTLLPSPNPPLGYLVSPHTVLYLRGGDHSLAQSPTDARNLQALHDLHLDVFAFDYRGYGQSDPTHPNQQRMTEDAQAALRYLREVRSIPESQIIVFGTGVGTSLATSLAATHPTIPALILDSPGPPPYDLVRADPRTRGLPTRLLFHEDFPLQALATLTTPKLLIRYPGTSNYPAAANPKFTLELQPNDFANLKSGILRFLGDSLPIK